MVAGTPCANGGDSTKNEMGLVNCHAYPVLGHATLSNGQKLVKLRNPWSLEYYHGPYSDKSDELTP